MDDDAVYHVEITAASTAALRDFVDETDADLGCRPVVRRRGEEVVLNAYLSRTQLDAAQANRSTAVALSVLENASETGLQRQRDVAEGNRYASRGAIPRGVGRKE